MSTQQENTFFGKNMHKNEINLEENAEVLKEMYADGIKETDRFSIEFYFLTDKESKAKNLVEAITKRFPQYSEIETVDFSGEYEISGITEAVVMELKSINDWNKTMWDLGYEFDCRFDGWQTGPEA